MGRGVCLLGLPTDGGLPPGSASWAQVCLLGLHLGGDLTIHPQEADPSPQEADPPPQEADPHPRRQTPPPPVGRAPQKADPHVNRHMPVKHNLSGR